MPVVRKYYKYVSWTQPILTSNTSNDCKVTYSAAYSGYDGYKALNGVTTDCWFNNTSTGWWQITFPERIRITALTHVAGAWSSQTQNITGRYYTDNTKTTPIGNQISGTYAQGTEVTISGIPSSGIITDTIYFEKTTGHANAGIGELIIAADTIQESTSSDYDFYKDIYISNCANITEPIYYKYVEQDMQYIQPIITSNGTFGQGEMAVSGSAYDSSYPAWKAFDGNTSTQALIRPSYLTMWFNKAINITKLKWNYHSGSYHINNCKLQTSEDGTTWIDAGSTFNASEVSLTMSNTYYNHYYRIYLISVTADSAGTSAGFFNDMIITATYKDTVAVESTVDDYDFIVNKSNFKCTTENRSIAVPTFSDKYIIPELTANETEYGTTNNYAMTLAGTVRNATNPWTMTLAEDNYIPANISTVLTIATQNNAQDQGGWYYTWGCGGITVVGTFEDDTTGNLGSYNTGTTYNQITIYNFDLPAQIKAIKAIKITGSGYGYGSPWYAAAIRFWNVRLLAKDYPTGTITKTIKQYQVI